MSWPPRNAGDAIRDRSETLGPALGFQALTLMQVKLGASIVGERIVAVGLLTQREVELLGHGFSRLWPVDKTPCFTDLLKAIDEADEELVKTDELKCEQAIGSKS